MEQKLCELSVSQAARWYARLLAPDCTESERVAFEKWRNLSVGNAKAYLEAERLAAKLSELMATNPRFSALAGQAQAKSGWLHSKSKSQPKKSQQWRVAAVVLLGVFVGSLSLQQVTSSATAAVVTNYHNVSKQQQRIVLADGSVAFIDVGSRISVKMTRDERHVDLLEGRAYFEVVHNSARPFFVNAGTMRTMDLGTRFQVALTPRDVSVTLVEGSVAVLEANSNTNWRETLVPGEQLLVHIDSGSKETHHVDAEAVTSWSNGRLVFKGTPLSEVLEEVNRYAESKIHLGDESLAAIPIGGNFIAGGDSSQVADALAAVLPLRIVHVRANEIVLFQRYEAEAP